MKKSKQKFKYRENEKSSSGKIKSIFHHFKVLSVDKNCLITFVNKFYRIRREDIEETLTFTNLLFREKLKLVFLMLQITSINT